jgi:hypothetical protein
MYLVVNEWLLEYFIPSVSQEKARLARRFLDKVAQTSAIMIIGYGTPFVDKFHRFMKVHGDDLRFKKMFSTLGGLLFRDFEKTLIITEPSEIDQDDLEGVNRDDWYLIQLARTVPESTIITTDTKLIDVVRRKGQVPILHLNEYLLDD